MQASQATRLAIPMLAAMDKRERHDSLAATAAELRQAAAQLRYQSSGGSYVRAARKGQQIRRLEQEAARLERRARRGSGRDEAFDLPF